MKSGFITLPNQQSIYYQEVGAEFIQKEPSLLFIHGNFSNSQWWHETILGLQHLKMHLIAIDQRGFGKSSYNTPCNRFESWAQDLKQFCKIRGISKCIANGWSFGGGVAMKLAQIAPQLVEKIILTCSVSHQGLRMSSKNKSCLTREQILGNPKAKYMVDLLNSKSLEKMSQVYELMLFTHSKDFPIEKKNIFTKASFQQRSYIQVLQALANSDISVENIKAKCLMIHGKQDMVVVFDSVKSTGEYFKNFVVWQNNGHMIPIQNPKAYNELVQNFIYSQ